MRSVGEASNLTFGFLVGFRSPDRKNESVGILSDIVDIESDELTPAQRPGEADEMSARSRTSMSRWPSGETSVVITFVRAARTLTGATPLRRRMPAHTDFKAASAVGVSIPAS